MKHDRLFCFTYAGGTADFFNVLKDPLEEIDVVGFEYAGHGQRHKEPFYNDFAELADDMFKLFKEAYDGNDYSLFGYSMGAITLVEVLKRITDNGMPLPKNVFLAAHEPHSKSELQGYSADASDEWVKERTIRFGAVPERLIGNRVFWRTYLPIYKADYSIIGKYRFEDLKIGAKVPATIFYSETDTPLTEMKQWDSYFSCEYFEFSGNHFFLLDHCEEIGKIIKDKMGIC